MGLSVDDYWQGLNGRFKNAHLWYFRKLKSGWQFLKYHI
ncbi:hypothetical protein A33Q_4551 [Indibacter alkaliphilus LW1]|uniref:Uncharacterized protein n=1 Tax=Indibacter alkaliphilus (strain CCUG 57479 / KCTC 22604 / LW1) TaxID=1189612 RepID=S2DNS9_INDAL|nr:hypothetical protein A33Q_4551 [Indibacter alkaliphilus LW1]